MKRMLTSGLLAMSLIGAVALPALAQDGRMPSAPMTVANITERLAAQEAQLGINAAQAPAWQAYRQTLLAFAQTAPQQPGTRPQRAQGERPPAPPAGAQAPRQGQPRALMAEVMAGQAIAHGASGDALQQAQALQKAAANLRTVLSDAQLARLIQAEAPPAPPSGKAPRG
ncbi:hypothetical protein FNJ84_01495 [Paracoccus sp. M683]|uniref:hypothetical protein n=1 Tax=Paracoccus sp. M683 TaxID=2594268 RepID=UPI001180EF48|nr:hypothetical protein [Paracoccus sp. M683]TRW99376.1 hypothetical protein FNJ84_01495 [Paracoccus sp. M683]